MFPLLVILNIFSYACYLYIFGEVSVKVFDRILNWVVFLLLNFDSFLFILDNSALLDVSFTNIFSQSMACLFILLIVSFTDTSFVF